MPHLRPLFLSLVVIAALVPAAGASASQITFDGSVLEYTAAPGEANMAIITVNPYELLCDPIAAPCISVYDPWVNVSYPAGACAGTGGDIRCVMPSAIAASLGDGEDSWWDWDGDSAIDAGSGDDNPIQGNGGDDVILGGGGSDNLIAGTGDDLIDGGPGNDWLEGVGIEGETATAGQDTYVGGGGRDALNYASRGDDLQLSPDDVADDGAGGEGDDIGSDITTIWAGEGSDTMVGNAAQNSFQGGNGDDDLIGNGGDDELSGGDGADRITGDEGQDILGGEDGDDLIVGGPDVDRFWGDEIGGCIAVSCASGADEIYARDGLAEAINCGPGTDAVQIDSTDYLVFDRFSSDECEYADGAAPAEGGSGTPPPAGSASGSGTPGQPAPGAASTGGEPESFAVARATANRGGKIAVRARVPGAGRLTVAAKTRRRGRMVRLATATRAARSAGELELVLRMPRRALAGRGALRIALAISFRPDGAGDTTTVRRTLTVRRTRR